MSTPSRNIGGEHTLTNLRRRKKVDIRQRGSIMTFGRCLPISVARKRLKPACAGLNAVADPRRRYLQAGTAIFWGTIFNLYVEIIYYLCSFCFGCILDGVRIGCVDHEHFQHRGQHLGAQYRQPDRHVEYA